MTVIATALGTPPNMPSSGENLKGWHLHNGDAFKEVLTPRRALVTIIFCCSLVCPEAFHEQTSFSFEILASGWNLLKMFMFGKNLTDPELRKIGALKLS